MDLTKIPEDELRAEITRRERDRNEEMWRQIREHWGPCPECGAEVTHVNSYTEREHWEHPGWKAWPVPPPEDWPGRKLVAQEIATAAYCANDHVRYESDIRFATERER